MYETQNVKNAVFQNKTIFSVVITVEIFSPSNISSNESHLTLRKSKGKRKEEKKKEKAKRREREKEREKEKEKEEKEK